MWEAGNRGTGYWSWRDAEEYVLPRRISADRTHFFLLTLFSFLILFVPLGRGDLSGYDDATFAHEAKEMILTGDWWNVRFNGYLHFDKPPLFVWCEAASMKVFGISDFAAKFPAALFGLGTILLVYFIARELTDRFWLPIIAMLVMTTTQYFMKNAMHAMTCVPFTFFFALAMLSYLKGLKQQRYLLLCGLATGLADLTRSPMGWFPLVIIVVHLIVTRQRRLLWSKYLIACFLIAVLLPMLWYWSEYRSYGSKFLSEHIANITAHAASEQKRGATQFVLGFFEYPYLLLKIYWPWLPFMVIGFATQFRKMLREREVQASLLVIWVLCVLLPFSLADRKVLRYILPAFPAFAILSASVLDEWIPSLRKPALFKLLYSLGCIFVLYAALFPMSRLRATDMRKLAPVAEANTAPQERVLLYTRGVREWNYQTQFLWYGNRYSELVTDLTEIESRFRSATNTVAIIDKESSDRLLAALGTENRERIRLLAQSENFACIKYLERSHLKGGT